MKYTLITGASRGIGESMAEYCAKKGYNLILVARSEDKLSSIGNYLSQKYKVEVRVFFADLSEQDAPNRIYDFCIENDLQVDKLINNAGVGLYGRFSEKPLDEQLALININLMATVKMTHLFVGMLKKGSPGYLMNVASTACYQPIPYMAIYAGTQSFLQSFTLSTREELRKSGVGVSCLCPGPTATDFFERAGLQSLPVNSHDIKMSPKEVAEIAIEGMLDKVAEIIPGTNNTIGAYFSKLLPNRWVVRTVSSLFAPNAA